MKTLKSALFALLMATTSLVSAQGQMTANKSAVEKNKEVVIRINKEYWEIGEVEIAAELLADNYVNHYAPPNGPNGASLMVQFIQSFKKGFSNVTVECHEVLAQGNRVSLIKTITATHTGDFMGKAATGKKVVINIVEIDALKDGKITDTWALSNLPQVIQAL
ncbi:MAG: ester cyclase [Bacteroidota bacterium]|nr:ester cyclase [Bacteroidota bacterium]